MAQHIYFLLAGSVSVSYFIGFLFLTRNIRFFSYETDNELQVKAAAQSHKWRWPSDIHRYGIGKTSMKDGMVLLLALFQKIFKNNYGERPLSALCGFSISVSGFLIFLIGAEYWGPLIGLWIGIIYLAAAWLWQVALYGGHLNVATMFFLASVVVIQKITSPTESFFLIFTAGALFCYTMFSSASSSKYVPLFFSALFFAKYNSSVQEEGLGNFFLNFFSHINYTFDIVFLSSLTLLFIILKSNQKRTVDILYNNKIWIIKKLSIIKGQTAFTREYYYEHMQKKLAPFFKKILIVYIVASFIFHLLSWQYLVPLFSGFFFLFFIFTLPNVKKNAGNYLFYVISPTKKTHFKEYIQYFAQRGIKVNRGFRGAGVRWLPKLYWRMAPVHTLIFIIATLFILITETNKILSTIILLTAAVSPIIWGELTGGPQASRTYSTGLIGYLLFIGYFTSTLPTTNLWLFIAISTSAIYINEGIVFFTDIYPARMTVPKLIEVLEKYKIAEFYTYNTRFNDPLVNAIPLEPTMMDKFKIHYIDKLSDVKNGWIVIPPTTHKAITVEGMAEAKDDYKKDPELNELLKTRKIENIATAKFKTISTSRIWVQETEVTSFLDLMLNDINDDDVFRSYAWLINAQSLKHV